MMLRLNLRKYSIPLPAISNSVKYTSKVFYEKSR